MDGGLGTGEKFGLGCVGVYVACRYLEGWTVAVLAVGAVLAWLSHQRWRQTYWARRGVPTPPGPSLLLGHFAELRKRGLGKVESQWLAEYGSVLGTYSIGNNPEIIVGDLELVRRILIKDFANFPNRRKTAMEEMYRSVRSKMMTTLRDDRWREIRRTASAAFTSGKMRQMLPTIRECIARLRQVLAERIERGETKLPLKELMGNLTMEVIAKTAFAIDSNAQRDPKDPFVERVNRMLNFSFKSVGAVMLFFFTKTTVLLNQWFGYLPVDPEGERFFHSAISSVVADRRVNKSPRRDFLQLLMDKGQISDEDRVADAEILHDIGHAEMRKLSEDEITAQSMLFLFAGYETTASTLHFLIYLLAIHPEEQDKCLAELEELWEGMEEGSELSYEDLLKMPYLEACVCETLRLYPPAQRTERYAETEQVLDGVRIPAGTTVAIPIYAIHHDAANWPEPEKFRPERFLGEATKRHHPMAFLPFGAGPRNCIGMRFAQMEIRLAMATLLPIYRFEPVADTPPFPLELKTTGLTAPVKPISIGAQKRQ